MFLPHPNPVNMRPIIIVITSGAIAMAVHPMTQGMRPILIVFNRPIDSIRNPAKMHPMGTEMTITEAIHEDSDFDACISVSLLSSLGMMMAEKANDIPMTMWKDAVNMAAII